MAVKLAKSTFPDGHKPEKFVAYGPAATKDGDFNGMMIADMGCFNQDGVDSNKYYCAMVTSSRLTGVWYAYFEWARTGAKNPQFQFIECASKEEAQKEFITQCMEKNVKRGEWVTVGGIRTLRAKAGKDCYLVRPQAKRSTGLPDARTICEVKTVVSVVSTKKSVDDQTMFLMRDLNLGAISYTRSSMADSSLPTQNAIDEARIMLGEAKKRLLIVGGDVETQVGDTELKALTAQLYGRIPKIKPLRAAADTWILSMNTIPTWEQDLDAYESALSADTTTDEYDPFAGLDVRMEYLPPDSTLGKFIRGYLPGMTNGRNGYGAMRIHHVWKVEHYKAEDDFRNTLNSMGKVNPKERPLFQPRERFDISPEDANLYKDVNAAFLVHGSRSVNCSGILKKRLCIPTTLVGVTLTAHMMGEGIYIADDWQKSAHYTSHSKSRYTHGSGSVKGRNCFLYLMDVLLGTPHIAPAAHNFIEPPKGHHSVMGKSGFTKGWNGLLINNEYVVYNSNQQQIRYLVEFS